MLQFVGLLGFLLVSSCFEPSFKTSHLIIFFFHFSEKTSNHCSERFLALQLFSEPVCCAVVLFISIFSEVRFSSSFLLLFFCFGVGINYGKFLIFSPFPFVFVLDLMGV